MCAADLIGVECRISALDALLIVDTSTTFVTPFINPLQVIYNLWLLIRPTVLNSLTYVQRDCLKSIAEKPKGLKLPPRQANL